MLRRGLIMDLGIGLGEIVPATQSSCWGILWLCLALGLWGLPLRDAHGALKGLCPALLTSCITGLGFAAGNAFWYGPITSRSGPA